MTVCMMFYLPCGDFHGAAIARFSRKHRYDGIMRKAYPTGRNVQIHLSDVRILRFLLDEGRGLVEFYNRTSACTANLHLAFSLLDTILSTKTESMRCPVVSR